MFDLIFGNAGSLPVGKLNDLRGIVSESQKQLGIDELLLKKTVEKSSPHHLEDEREPSGKNSRAVPENSRQKGPLSSCYYSAVLLTIKS